MLKSIRFELTAEQRKALAPHFRRVREHANKGRPGAIMGQIRQNNDGTVCCSAVFLNERQTEAVFNSVSKLLDERAR